MKNCLVLGGGIAGLSTATYLTLNNFSVTLLESSPKCGGRVKSYYDDESKSYIDNGQHLLMGCYTDTLNFLNIINARDNFIYQKNLQIKFLVDEGTSKELKADLFPYPFNLLKALLNFRAINFVDRVKLLGLLIALPLYSDLYLKKRTVYELLIDHWQSENVIKKFWEVICYAALNSDLHTASALMFKHIITKMFLNGNLSSTLIFPSRSLTESIINPAYDFLASKGCKIKLSENAKEFEIKDDNIISVRSSKNEYSGFDFVISALPHYALEKIVKPTGLKLSIDFEYSAIINIHLWIKNNPFNELFYGLLDSELQWIFNKGDHINVVISNANKFKNVVEAELINLVISELNKFKSINASDIIRFKIIREKKATFIPSNSVIFKRPKSKSNLKNLFLAGDWVNTNLPATIESAVMSGRLAVEAILNN